VTNRLHTIGMKDSCILLTELSNFFYGQQHSDFIVSMQRVVAVDGNSLSADFLVQNRFVLNDFFTAVCLQ